jgi:hypothetical protein
MYLLEEGLCLEDRREGRNGTQDRENGCSIFIRDVRAQEDEAKLLQSETARFAKQTNKWLTMYKGMHTLGVVEGSGWVASRVLVLELESQTCCDAIGRMHV